MKMLDKVVIAVVLVLCCYTVAVAETIYFSAEEGGALFRIPPPDGNVIEVIESPGNAHAVIHSTRAKVEGYNSCTPCHNGQGAEIAYDKFICSQYNFEIEGRRVSDGQGGFISDPVSGQEIVSGRGIAVLLSGDKVTCKMCHYPHKTGGFKAEDYLVHEGCLDCHKKVGSDDLRKGVKDEDD